MVYLDTSVAVPLFVSEKYSDMIDRWISDCEIPLVAADWILTEFASALSIKERSAGLSAKDAKLAWRGFETFCASGLRLAPVSRNAFREAAKMIRDPAHGLRASDALHLAVVIDIDANMASNAKRLKLKTVAFS